ncbi:hypothetical protein EST38_g1851 [Candolleomyces aberdarensis]|uniref:Uncharacterized protein n=1 Tax=Candolleomyces aberdarensis TaxID=2316362 RepID=A0A4Q2DV60_9AGAR|nr:hypothetical protein EST38_g1851 [Candolleomyces aberdarensis]
MVHSFATLVTSVASGMLQLQTESTAISTQINAEVNAILSEEIDNHLCREARQEGHQREPPQSYIQLAYEWLSVNLHNPYPSAEVRYRIATDSNSLRKDIDAWFIDARRRVGWNSLRKKHFNNKRADIVAAATRFFVKEETLKPDIESEMMRLKMKIDRLFSPKFEQSKLATQLDLVVRDMTPQLQAECLGNRRSNRKRERDALSYPTPERSPNSFSQSLSPFSSPGSTTMELPDAPPSLKRRRSSVSDVSDYEALSTSDRGRPAAKRCNGDSCRNTLPSPASSCVDVAEEDPVATVNDDRQRSASRKRKCHVDEANAVPEQKRPRAADFPVSLQSNGSLQQWFDELFSFEAGIPPSVTRELDPTATINVEAFNTNSLNSDFSFDSGNIIHQACKPQIASASSLNTSLHGDETPLGYFPIESCSWLDDGLATSVFNENAPTFEQPGSSEVPTLPAFSTPHDIFPAFHQDIPTLPTDYWTYQPPQLDSIASLDHIFNFSGGDLLSDPAPSLPSPSFLSEKARKEKHLQELQAQIQAIQAEINATS